MRYIINTEDSEGIIGMQIAKWKQEGKLDIIEKADPVTEINANLEKAQRALDVLKKAGLNSEVMTIWLTHKTGMGMEKVKAFLRSQDDFFKATGLRR